MFAFLYSLGPLAVVGFLFALVRFSKLMRGQGAIPLPIAQTDNVAILTFYTVITSAVVVLLGIDNMSKFTLLHANLIAAITACLSVATLFFLRSKYPRYVIIWTKIAKRGPEVSIGFGVIFLMLVQFVQFHILPIPLGSFEPSKQHNKFLIQVIGLPDFSIGFGAMVCWVTAAAIVGMVASLNWKIPDRTE